MLLIFSFLRNLHADYTGLHQFTFLPAVCKDCSLYPQQHLLLGWSFPPCFKDLLVFYFCICVYTCMHVPVEAEEGIGSLETGVTGAVNSLVLVLRTKPGSSTKAISTLNRPSHFLSLIGCFLDITLLTRIGWNLKAKSLLICFSPMTQDTKHFFNYLLAICSFPSENYIQFIIPLLVRWFVFLIFNSWRELLIDSR